MFVCVFLSDISSKNVVFVFLFERLSFPPSFSLSVVRTVGVLRAPLCTLTFLVVPTGRDRDFLSNRNTKTTFLLDISDKNTHTNIYSYAHLHIPTYLRTSTYTYTTYLLRDIPRSLARGPD